MLGATAPKSAKNTAKEYKIANSGARIIHQNTRFFNRLPVIDGLREAGAGGSNPLSPTNEINDLVLMAKIAVGYF